MSLCSYLLEFCLPLIISGTIPTILGALGSIAILDFRENSFTGMAITHVYPVIDYFVELLYSYASCAA